MELRKISETASKMTIAWDPVPGAAAGYRGRAEGVEKWTQTQQTQMTFAKGANVEIQALGVVDSGKYPPEPVPGPTDEPTAPTGLTAVREGTGVRLSWNANPAEQQVDGYQVYIDGQLHEDDVDATTYLVPESAL